jgi:hypothetical protein
LTAFSASKADVEVTRKAWNWQTCGGTSGQSCSTANRSLS